MGMGWVNPLKRVFACVWVCACAACVIPTIISWLELRNTKHSCFMLHVTWVHCVITHSADICLLLRLTLRVNKSRPVTTRSQQFLRHSLSAFIEKINPGQWSFFAHDSLVGSVYCRSACLQPQCVFSFTLFDMAGETTSSDTHPSCCRP